MIARMRILGFAIAFASVARLGPAPIITHETYERSAKTVTLTDASNNEQAYTFSTEAESQAVAIVVSMRDTIWLDSTSDSLTLSYDFSSSSGTLPSLGSVSTVCVSGSTVSFNTASRTLGSASAANDFAEAVNAARDLVSGQGASLSQSGSTLTLTIPLP